MKFTTENLVKSLDELPKDQFFEYPNPATKTRLAIEDITLPLGPIKIKRYKPSEATPKTAKSQSISVSMLTRVASAIREGVPLNVDRILGASYSTRSSLEALMARTREFYMCYPGRLEGADTSTAEIKNGHKHLIYLPNEPHAFCEIHKKEISVTISEIPTAGSVYEAIQIDPKLLSGGMDLAEARRHIQIQVALVFIGQALGFRTYVAKNDQGVIYDGKPIRNLPGVVADIETMKLIGQGPAGAGKAAKLIDCVWFQNGRLMPAVLEVEHSTGVTSGLARMKGFQDAFPPFPTRYTIVAPDDKRADVFKKASLPQFEKLDTHYFSYSAVEELFSLCQRGRVNKDGVSEAFLDGFMERVLSS